MNSELMVKIGANIKDFQTKMGGIKGTLQATKNSLAGLGKIGAVAFAGFSAAAVSSIKAYREQELAVNKLNASLKAQGIYSVSLSKNYQTMAGELQKLTTYGDEATIKSMSIIQSFAGQTRQTKESTLAMMNFASAMNIDLSSAAQLIGKTMGSTTNMLSRYGIEVDMNTRGSARMAAITDALNKKFAGQAEAAAQGTGKFIQMSNRIGDLKESFGKLLMDALGPAMDAIDDIIYQWEKMAESGFSASDFLRKGVIYIIAAFKNLGTIIGAVVGGAVEALQKLGSLDLSGAAKALPNAYNFAKDEVVRIAGETNQQLDKLEKEKIERTIENENEKNNALKEIAETKKTEDEELSIEDAAQKREKELTELEANRQFLINKRMDEIREHNLRLIEEQKYGKTSAAIRAFFRSEDIQNLQSTFSTISTLSSAHTKGLMVIGKAAAIAQSIMSTFQAATMALAAPPGPPWSFGYVGAVIAAGMANVAQIMGVKLAKGGIVMPTPGGTQAIIGEAGSPEAVIPLNDDRAADMLGGAQKIEIDVNFTGDLAQYIEKKTIERRNLRISLQGAY